MAIVKLCHFHVLWPLRKGWQVLLGFDSLQCRNFLSTCLIWTSVSYVLLCIYLPRRLREFNSFSFILGYGNCPFLLVNTYKCTYKRGKFVNMQTIKCHGPQNTFLTKLEDTNRKRKRSIFYLTMRISKSNLSKFVERTSGSEVERTWEIRDIHLVCQFKTLLTKPPNLKYLPPFIRF